jgi:hypothetical protein
MKRSIALLLAAVLLAGCNKNQTPPGNDPFIFGRQTVPPPGTGAATGRVGDPSYRGPAVAAAAPGALAPPSVSLPPPSSSASTRDMAPAASSTVRSVTPPAPGWNAPAAARAETTMTPRGAAASAASTRTLGNYPGAPRPPASSLAASPPSTIRIPEPSAGSGVSGGTSPGRTTFTRSLGPRPATAPAPASTYPGTPASPAGYKPMPTTTPGKPIDIMTLPRLDDLKPSTNERSSAGESGVRFATGGEETVQPDRVVVAGGATAADSDIAEAADR